MLFSVLVSLTVHAGVLGGMGRFSLFFGGHLQNPRTKLVDMKKTPKYAVLPDIRMLGPEKRISPEKGSSVNKDASLPKKSAAAMSVLQKPRLKKESPKARQAMLRYQDMVKQEIEAHRVYPPEARYRHIEGTVDVSFEILPDGRARDVRVMRSSGAGMLDREATATIRRASPFRAFPPEISRDSITIHVAIVFALN